MAEGNLNTRDRISPTEDFNPLAEDLIPDPTDADMSSDDDEPSDRLRSMDGELEDYFNTQAAEIPFSPPKSSRQAKRDKVRYGKKSSKDKYMTSDKLKKSVVNVIKERYGDSNNLYTGLTGVDSDADVEKEVSREHKDKKKKDRDDKQKTMTKNRQHDIYDKRMSGDATAVGTNISTDTAPLEIQTPVVPVKLTGSGRFHSFKILPVSTASLEPVERRQPCASKSECHKDRLAFYKTFAALINMGSHGKKQKEQRDKDRFFSQRQKSSDEKLWFNYIWIGLQAWLNGVSPQQQEADVQHEREKVPKVLDDVKNFKVQFSQNFLGFNIGGQAVCESGVPSNRNSTESVDTSSIADIQETYHTMYLSTEMINQQQEALEQVKQILNRLDQCEQLFPTSCAFAQEFTMYKEPDFVKRFEALYLWLNITEDLCHKLKLLGKVINVESIPGANWPTIDFDCPRSTVQERTSVAGLHCASIPEIMQNSASEEEEMDEAGDGLVEEGEGNMDNAEKKVSFAVSEEQGLESFTTSLRRTPSPSNMTNPQDSSTPVKFNTSISHASSEASLEDLSRSSLYRSYVDKGLKKVGLNKILVRLRDILDCSLQRARNSLERPRGEFLHSDSICKSPTEDLYSHVPSSPSLDLLDKQSSSTLHICSRCLDQVTWRQEFLDIGLPSFRPTYMFLVRVLLDVIHEAMKIRLDQLKNPICDPSFHSKRQLIRDCKDVLAKAVLVKQYYQHMIAAVLDDDELDSENSPMDLEAFDDDMSNMFKMYFQYLQNWLYDLQNLPEASRSLKIPLEEEWSFTKKICPHIIGGEAEAGKRFSTMAISLLNSIADFLDSSTDEYTTSLFDWTNQDIDVSSSESDQSDDDDDHDSSQQSRSKSLKQSFQKTCRNFKNLFHEARERASKALGFAKLLKKDLEIAADFDIIVPTGKLLKKLKETGHVRIQTPLPAGYLMFIPERIADQRRQILQLLNVTCGREGIAAATDPSPKDEGYLLMVRCVGDGESPVWEGTCIQVEPTAETAIALSHLQVTSLLLVVIHSSHLSSQRRDFETLMNSTVELVNEQTSCHQVITDSLFDLKESAISLRDKVAAVIRRVDENWNCDTELEGNEKIHVLKLYRETMLQAYNFGFEYMKEVTRLVSGETRHKLGHGLVNFAMDFMKFVSEKCERGRGMRPRWANQGLDFLLVACDPKILSVLSEQEYQDLQQRINEFISHLIGSADKTSPWSPTHGGGLPMARSATESSIRQPYNRYQSWPAAGDNKMARSSSTRSVQSESQQQTPHSAPAGTTPYSRSKKHSDGNIEVDLHDGDDGGIVMDVHKCRAASGDNLVPAGFSYKPQFRIVNEINKLEQHRSDKLQTSRVIGRVTNRKSGVSYHVNARKVKFHWHKGKKIGEGQFGKVYSAVNMDTGELMAMKEMKFSTTDMQMHIKEIIDEITIFEGINHPNLVKYYGVEVHRAEMFVFMEYCDQGTLDQVSLVGLPEELIRIYTRELLIAVHKLHENGIVHRDIKGQNIFLTSKGCLKLGDFGCSVKLKNHTTMAGEVNSLVGTTAYMAPEVITRSDREGHGRAADIWSVGCVVIEMASGKRPWHELESNYQIMFKVGMGYSPPIPDTLGSEGKDFLAHCLEHDPVNRWTAIQLRDHPFPKICDEDEERTSQP